MRRCNNTACRRVSCIVIILRRITDYIARHDMIVATTACGCRTVEIETWLPASVVGHDARQRHTEHSAGVWTYITTKGQTVHITISRAHPHTPASLRLSVQLEQNWNKYLFCVSQPPKKSFHGYNSLHLPIHRRKQFLNYTETTQESRAIAGRNARCRCKFR